MTEAGRRTSGAELVAVGGTVLAMDDADTRGSGLAVRDGRVIAIADDEDIRGHCGADTRVVDLRGHTVIPGINDSHLHATWLGALWPKTLFDGGGPVPSGRLVEGATGRRTAILRAGDICAELGITSYTEPGLGPGEDDGETGCFSQAVLEEYATLAAAEALRARVTVLRLFGRLDGPSTLADFEHGIHTACPGADPAWLNVAGVKIFADGIPPMRSAWTTHHYPDGTGGGLLVRGESPEAQERNLMAMIRSGHRAGLQVGVHATGDRSIDAVIRAVAEATRSDGVRRRHYVIHADLVSEAQLARMRELGLGITTQPSLAGTTREMVLAALGSQVADSAWPLTAMLDHDIGVTLSSDAPVLAPDWRVQMAAAAEWMGVSGHQPGLAWRLLRCYTAAPAVQDGAEEWKGTLLPGQVADFVVLGDNPLLVDIADLPNVSIEATFVNGHEVFTRGAGHHRPAGWRR